MKRLLLDTNVVLWLLLGDRGSVSPTAVAALEDEPNAPMVSAASVWEIAIKRALGKLTIADDWFTALRRLDLEPLPVTAFHAASVERLPFHHRDPFDRILVAQTIAEGAELVSPDARLSAYAISRLW